MPHEAPDLAVPRVSRRALLRAGSAIGAQLVVGIPLSGAAGAPAAASTFAPNAFVAISADDRITLVLPAVEMGQGAYTSLAAMLAEELDVPLARVTLQHAPPDPRYVNPALGIQATGGSTTTMVWFVPIRQAGATARAMLVQAAAQQWRVAASSLATADGAVVHAASGRSARYGALARDAARQPAPATVTLKDAKDLKLIGRAVKRLDAPAKVDGTARFGIDVMLPGMKIATLRASPVIGGRLRHADSAAALKVRGVRQVVLLDDLAAVIGDDMWAATQGLAALHVEWDGGGDIHANQARLWADLEEASHGPGVTAQRTGDAAQALVRGEPVEAVYELPFLAHAPMEPMNCTVHATPGACEIWVGTQAPGFAQAGAAGVLGLQPAQVTIHNHLIGGGFGRRLEVDGVIKAARIAQKVDGPVKVVWTREEDIRQDIYRPLYHDRLRAVVEGGRVTAWHHRVTGPSILARWLPPGFKDGIDPDAIEGAVKPPYDFADVLVEYVRHETPVVTVGFWRGVGPNSSVFSAECFLDLLARRSRVDPLAFRRNMLQGNPRALRVLELAAAKAAWGTPARPPGADARIGQGIALLDGFGSFLAAVVEVAVADDGDVRVRRIVCAADVGVVVNPDTVVAQIQGGTIFGLGTVLYDAITIADGRVQQSNFHDFRLPRIDDIPAIETHLVPSTEKPGGIGEPGTVVVQPAIANAVFAATGIQPTRMPIDRRQQARKPS